MDDPVERVIRALPREGFARGAWLVAGTLMLWTLGWSIG
jgi:hypothetical protein